MSKKHLEAKKRHHYVWANYLTRWSNGTNKVHYTTKTGKIAYDSVRAIVADDYFYKISPLTKQQVEVIKGFSKMSPENLHMQHMEYLSDFLKFQLAETEYKKSGIKNTEVELHLHVLKCNLLENLHAAHERAALPIISALADEKLDTLDDKKNMLEFSIFLGHQISRTKTFRDRALQNLHRSTPTEIAIADAMKNAWWFVSYMYGMSIGYSFFTARRGTTQAILINETEIPFITSDNPVINIHSCVSETEMTPPEYADFYYPISPRVAITICDSNRFQPGKNVISESTVKELNSKIAGHAMINIIGNSEQVISDLKKLVGRSYKQRQSNRES